MHYAGWCALSDAELARCDIAEVNLAAAVGLPGADSLDVAALCAKVDAWAALVGEATRRALPRRAADAANRDLTEAQFRMLVLVTVLQRKLGVTYNRAFSEGEYDARDARNLFIHGLLTGHGGTCVTMPVLFAAIGRRLGYPLTLALAKEHMFCRWDDSRGERFNIEATSPGLNIYDDDFYHSWPFPLSEIELATGRYLESLSPREELAHFLGNRGNCLRDNLQGPRALEAYYYAAKLDLRRHDFQHMLCTLQCRIVSRTRELFHLPPGPHAARLLDFLAPTPAEGGTDEEACIRLAKQDLLRIVRLHAPKLVPVAPRQWNHTVIA